MTDAPQTPDIPDEIVQQILADPKMRQALEDMLKASNVDVPLDQLPMDLKKQAIAALMQASQASAPPAPPEVVQQVLNDPEALGRVNELLKANNVPQAFEDLPADAQAGILGQIIAQQQAQQQQDGPSINVDLEALKQTPESFDKIWQESQQEAGADVAKFKSLIQGKLFAAGAPAGAISELVAQIPSPEGQA